MCTSVKHALVLILCVCVAMISARTGSGRLSLLSKLKGIFDIRKDNDNIERTLLPQLPPHEDTCYLLEFVTDGSDHCIQMDPVVERLEKDLNTKVRKINISRKNEFVKLYDCVGGNECGSVPFFYNRRTAQAICGATPYQNLKRLAMGDPIHFFIDAPQNAYEKPEYDPRQQRGVGFGDFLSEKLFRRNKLTSRGGSAAAAKKESKTARID